MKDCLPGAEREALKNLLLPSLSLPRFSAKPPFHPISAQHPRSSHIAALVDALPSTSMSAN